MRIDRRSENHWLELVLESLQDVGFATVAGVLSSADIERIRGAVYRARDGLAQRLGGDTLECSARQGQLEIRLPMQFDSEFLRCLETEELLAVVDRYLNPNATLRFQNALIVPPDSDLQGAKLPQRSFHMNFPRPMNGFACSLEIGFNLDPTAVGRGVLFVVPGSHRRNTLPPASYLERAEIPVPLAAGDMFFMDGMLWHREGANDSSEHLVSVGHQFTRSYIKPHFDYPRALGTKHMESLPERTRKLLGWHTRVPASLEEFYAETEQRLYQPDQD